MATSRTVVLAQIQLADADVKVIRLSEDKERVSICVNGNEVILDRATVQRAYRSFPRRRKKVQ